MKTAELRKRYLDFFKERGHTFFVSDTLVPDDASLLFTSAGMNQFKAYFLGEKKDVRRATSCQKCLRTGDLERVGKTAYHHTFFEMLGNFSFGDYFKKEAIEFAWEFLTEELSIKKDRLWVSVYTDDDEAYRIWKDQIKVPREKIVKLGADSNFWPANAPSQGPNGPCGPCSEIFFDRGADSGCRKPFCNPDCDCGRFVEIWNLVFTQFNRIGQDRLEPLPQKNIDTGMGLERMASVLQGKASNFEIDILQPAVEEVKNILSAATANADTPSLINAIVDHSRAAVFAITDGVYPSNEERGYVIRKIIRTALSNALRINCRKPFIHKLVPLFAELMGDFYPEIIDKKDVVAKVIKAEEENLLPILKDGEEKLLAMFKKVSSGQQDKIDAKTIFDWHDTYGFTLGALEATASNHHIDMKFLDIEGAKRLLEQQRRRSRSSSMFDENIFSRKEFTLNEKTEFVGYEHDQSEATALRFFSADKEVQNLSEGARGLIVLDKTPFYAESGGQLTDKGKIISGQAVFEVEKVFKVNEAVVHQGKVISGAFEKGKLIAVIDRKRRQALARAHTATHLLQAALRRLLGEHVSQQGSLVDEDRLRFDFTHFQALTPDEIVNVEDLVLEYILSADTVNKEKLTLSEAQERGALAFFKDKYDNEVRVVSIGDYSKELCGGTHLNNTAEVGAFIIESESSIASGIRRIEAVVGERAYDYIRQMRRNIADLSRELKVSPEDLLSAVRGLRLQIRQQKAIIDTQHKELLGYKIDDICKDIKKINGFSYIGYSMTGKDYAALLFTADELRKKEKSLFLFLVSSADKNIFVCAATADFVKKGLDCKAFLQRFYSQLGLRGGGKDFLVQGVIEKLDKGFLKKVENCFEEFSRQ